jgi:cyclopropane fatty-acyl-phospholipid synthase-like methyltransferase
VATPNFGFKSPCREGLRFLDVGSGVGTGCLAAARHGAARVVGLDGSPENLLIAHDRVQAVSLPLVE